MDRIPSDALLDAAAGVSYVVDTEGTILAIGRRNWTRFARENAGPRFFAHEPFSGRNLFDYIAGEEVAAAYRVLLARAALEQDHEERIAYRCDSPGIRRKMMMRVSGVWSGGAACGVLFQSFTLDETQRPPLELFDLEASLARYYETATLPILVMCSFCQRVRWPDDSDLWLEAEAYYAAGGSSDVRISHGVCTDCRAAVHGEGGS